ncbi:hypothetical protein BH18VER2_BH18VER2_03920 [soil metagenome]
MRFAARALVAAGLWLSGLPATADTFTVMTANSLGAGSLFEAIELANANPDADTIVFAFPGSGVHTISVGENGLPEITDPVTLDGYTQPGANANTLTIGNDAVILIRIDGAETGETPHHGLIIRAGDSVVRGLALTGFPNIFENFGETIFAGTAIILQDKGNNLIEGNFIGLSSDELLYGYNTVGIDISSSDNIVGGTLPAQRNIISHNFTAVAIGGSGNIVQGNYVGTDPSSAVAMSNGIGLLVTGSAAQIGGLTPEAANVISGNQYGIYIASSGTENIVQGNLIGTDVTGLVNLANFNAGVSITGSNNMIGGLAIGAGNRIFFNFTAVQVKQIDTDHPALGNSILSNCIYANGYPVDLDASGNFDGATRNDLGDGDTGPNNFQNFPIITSTTFLPDRTTVEGGLNSTPSTTFTLQFFSQDVPLGESTFLDTETITTNAAGLAYFAFDLQPLSPDLFVTATVTDPDGNTSEFPYQYAVQLANISTRGQVGTGDDILISGFVVHRPPDGPADYTKKVLLRALGPSLAVDGVPLLGRLNNPNLELHDASGAILATNDDWRSDQEAEIIAAGVAPSSDAEAALIADLPDGSYTVQVRGAGNAVGLGLTEVYDLEPLDPVNEPASGRLVNISTRGLVGTGDNPLIGGLIVNGDDAERVVIRAIGPDLAAQVPNFLPDPTLELRDGSGALLASNDDWRDEQEEELAATGLAPNDDRDSAILFSLVPGAYTAIVRGQGESSGVGLVEVYDLNLGH